MGPSGAAALKVIDLYSAFAVKQLKEGRRPFRGRRGAHPVARVRPGTSAYSPGHAGRRIDVEPRRMGSMRARRVARRVGSSLSTALAYRETAASGRPPDGDPSARRPRPPGAEVLAEQVGATRSSARPSRAAVRELLARPGSRWTRSMRSPPMARRSPITRSTVARSSDRLPRPDRRCPRAPRRRGFPSAGGHGRGGHRSPSWLLPMPSSPTRKSPRAVLNLGGIAADPGCRPADARGRGRLRHRPGELPDRRRGLAATDGVDVRATAPALLGALFVATGSTRCSPTPTSTGRRRSRPGASTSAPLRRRHRAGRAGGRASR